MAYAERSGEEKWRRSEGVSKVVCKGGVFGCENMVVVV